MLPMSIEMFLLKIRRLATGVLILQREWTRWDCSGVRKRLVPPGVPSAPQIRNAPANTPAVEIY